MSANHDISRAVRSWIREDEHDSADNILQVVLSRLDSTPQRRSWWPARRTRPVIMPLRIALVAATLAAAAVTVGSLQILPAVIGPTDTPVPSPTERATPTATLPPFPAGGAVEPGRYFVRLGDSHVTFKMPVGWLSSGFGPYKIADRFGPTSVTVSMDIVLREPTHVYADACDREGALQPVGPTAADLVRALDEQLSTDAAVQTITLGALSGTRVDLVAATGVVRADCTQVPGGLQIWADSKGLGFYVLAPGQRGTVIVTDVGAKRLVFKGSYGIDASPSDLVELDAIIDSMVIEP